MAVNIGPKIGIDGEAEYRREINNIIQQSKTLASEMKAVTAGFDDNTSAQKKAKAQAEVLAKQVKTQTERVDKLTDMLEKSKKEFGENDTRTQKWQQAVNEANAELNKMTNELKDAERQSSKFRTAIGNAGNKVKDLSVNGVQKLGSALSSGFKTAVKGTISVIGALTAAAGAAIIGLGKIGLEYNMEMESYTTNFQTMLGSAEAAAAKVESLKKMAAATPFEMTDLADATQQLLAMGVANQDTNKYLQQLGDISLGNVEKFNSLIGAFGKMNSSGKVTLEYINIMAEQGFNPLNLIAQKTGETMTEVYTRVSKGQVTFDEVKEAINSATSAGGQFYKGMEQASKTTEGMISTLKDNATALVGEVFEPISDSLGQTLLPGAISAVDRLSTAFETGGVKAMVLAAGNILGETVGEFAAALPDFMDVAVDIVDSFLLGITSNIDSISDGATDAVLALADGIIDMAPELIVSGVLLIGKLLAGLILGLPDLIASIPDMVAEICDGFAESAPEFEQIGEDIVMGIWESLETWWANLSEWFSGLWEDLLPSVSDIGSDILDFFSNFTFHAGGEITYDGSHAGGLGYVPWDGYLAELHQGEMVLTRAEADALRRGETAYVGSNTVNYGGFNFTIYAAEGQNVDQIADAVLERFQTEIERREAAFT